MSLNNTSEIKCPYCWQSVEIEWELYLEKQEFVEDCHVCCNPILFQVTRQENNDVVLIAVPENN